MYAFLRVIHFFFASHFFHIAFLRILKSTHTHFFVSYRISSHRYTFLGISFLRVHFLSCTQNFVSHFLLTQIFVHALIRIAYLRTQIFVFNAREKKCIAFLCICKYSYYSSKYYVYEEIRIPRFAYTKKCDMEQKSDKRKCAVKGKSY